MKKYISVFSIVLIVVYGCNNEEEPNNLPGISITKPIENQELINDYAFEVEGLATDVENLSSIHFKISSPNASYDYVFEDSLIVNGSSYDYVKWFNLPPDVSIGPAQIEVYAKDDQGEKSDHVIRYVMFKDNIEPVGDTLNSLLYDQDSIQCFFYPNAHGIYDSVSIWNYTQGVNIANYTDDGGFREVAFYRGGESGSYPPQEGNLVLTGLTDDPAIAGFKIELIPGYGGYYFGIAYLKIILKQYHPSYSPLGHLDLKFWVNP